MTGLGGWGVDLMMMLWEAGPDDDGVGGGPDDDGVGS